MGRYRSLGPVLVFALACAAPTCQDANPEFVEDEDGGADGASSTTVATDDGVMTTMSMDTGDGSADSAMTEDSADSGTADDMGTTDAGDTSASEDGTTAADTAAESETGACPGGEMMCGPVCIDVQTDDDNCGKCGNKCTPPGSTSCVMGECVPN